MKGQDIMLPSLREKEDSVAVLDNDIMEKLKIVMMQSQQFQEMMMMYKCAIPNCA